jgi:hypothetical protein
MLVPLFLIKTIGQMIYVIHQRLKSYLMYLPLRLSYRSFKTRGPKQKKYFTAQ